MRTPQFRIWAVLCLLAIAAAGLQAQPGNSVLFRLPGAGAGQSYEVYSATAAQVAQIGSFAGPTGGYRVIPKPDGTKYYIIASSSLSPLSSIQSNLTGLENFSTIAGSGATAAGLSPDGRFLLIVTTRLYIIDISGATETLVNSGGIGITGAAVDITFNLEGTRAFVLSRASTVSYVTAINLSVATPTVIGSSLELPGGVTDISTGPTGSIYVLATNRMFVLDPSSNSIRPNGEIAFVGTPRSLVFTPDGKWGLTINTTPVIGGKSIIAFDLTSNAPPSTWPAGQVDVPLFDKLLVASNSLAFLWARENSTLYDLDISPLNVRESSLRVVTSINRILDAEVSNELPNARFLYVIVNNGGSRTLQRIELTAEPSVSSQTTVPLTDGNLSLVNVPPQTTGASFQLFNNNQVVNQGVAAGLPLIFRLLDATGRPVFNAPVTVTTTSTATVSPSTVNTNIDGIAQVRVTAAPATPGAFQIVLNAPGPVTASFTLTVPGDTGGGGGGGGNPGVASLFILRGNGQILSEGATVVTPLTVVARDAAGNPVAGLTVSFEGTSIGGSITATQAVTDANGEAAVTFIGGFLNGGFSTGTSFVQTTVTASAPGYGAAQFVVTTTLSRTGNGFDAPRPLFEILKPESDFAVTLRAGEVTTDAVVYRVIAQAIPSTNVPIPNVSMRFVDLNNITGPAPAVCSNRALSNEEGIGRCDLQASCTVGDRTVALVFGDYQIFQPFTLRITPGGGSRAAIASGNNQTGRAGTALPLPLQVSVENNCGQSVGGQTVAWRITQGGGTLTNVENVTNANGRASARLTLGNTAGNVVITATVGTTTLTFNAVSTVAVSGISVVSGNNQTANTGQAFAQPLVVQIRDGSNNPVQNFPVTFAVSSGSATVSPASGNSDAQGRAQTIVTAGSTAGPIVITASAGTFTATFNLTSRPPGPAITANSFVNGASFQPGLSPCALGSVSGAGLAPGVNGAVIAPGPFGGYPTTLAGISITIGAFAAPISAVINQGGREQVNFQVPCDVQPGIVNATITINGNSTVIPGLPVTQYQPGIFEFTGTDGRRYATLIRPDGSYVTPQNPARRGELLYLFATGMGQTTPRTGTNVIGLPGQRLAVPVVVGVNNAGVRVVSADYLVGQIGTYIVQFEVPADTQPGPYQPLGLAVSPDNNTLIFGGGSFFPIQ